VHQATYKDVKIRIVRQLDFMRLQHAGPGAIVSKKAAEKTLIWAEAGIVVTSRIANRSQLI
jgi:hypothetical protein